MEMLHTIDLNNGMQYEALVSKVHLMEKLAKGPPQLKARQRPDRKPST